MAGLREPGRLAPRYPGVTPIVDTESEVTDNTLILLVAGAGLRVYLLTVRRD
jgi:hypothetical protein